MNRRKREIADEGVHQKLEGEKESGTEPCCLARSPLAATIRRRGLGQSEVWPCGTETREESDEDGSIEVGYPA